MQEYLVKRSDVWWHFFIKPHYGLCFRKREGGRFSNFEVLYPEGSTDFCAVVMGEEIHLVCQNQNGGIVHLSLLDETWHKTVLLESKSGVPYPKYFSLVPVGKFLNVFYIITYQDKYMLVHQIPGLTDKPPAVVDRIQMDTPPFIVRNRTGTDLLLCYTNESGVSGYRVYRWSGKTFGRFIPINPALGAVVKNLRIEAGDRVRYVALQSVNGIRNLICFESNSEGIYGEIKTVNLDCPVDTVPVFGKDGETLYISWYERGAVTVSRSEDDGKKWSKPMRYIKGASADCILYGIWEKDGFRQAYGYEKEGDIVFYSGESLSGKEIKKQRGYRPAGYEAEDFAKEMGHDALEEPPSVNPVFEALMQEISALKEQFLQLRQLYAVLLERTESLKEESPKVAGAEPNREAEM